jgi:hypothetical protein
MIDNISSGVRDFVVSGAGALNFLGTDVKIGELDKQLSSTLNIDPTKTTQAQQEKEQELQEFLAKKLAELDQGMGV